MFVFVFIQISHIILKTTRKVSYGDFLNRNIIDTFTHCDTVKKLQPNIRNNYTVIC